VYYEKYNNIDGSWSLNRNRILKFEKNLDPMSSEISDLCEISDLLLFLSYFASWSEGINFGEYSLMCAV